MASPRLAARPEAGRRWRRRGLWLLALLGVWFLGRPVAYLTWVALRDPGPVLPADPFPANDRSGLEGTEVLEVWPVAANREEAIAGLQALLQRAERDGLPVSIAGARHSMGGHTIAPDGIVIDMRPLADLSFDQASGLLRAGAGALWSDILAFLDPLGLSVAVMQSNDSFSVGGSISVNCHGWQHGRPPIASTVRALRLMQADGSVLTCSRSENSELFSLVLGGYGLFGVVLDVDLELVPNELYEWRSERLPRSDLGPSFLQAAAKPDVGLALGRLSIRPDARFDEALFKRLIRIESNDPLPTLQPSGSRRLRRTVFRGSIASDYGKRLRWNLESRLAPRLPLGPTTRNEQLAESVDTYANLSARGTDILQEYFVPHAALDDFLRRARPVFDASPCDLLNVTVRDVRTDHDSFLRYADQDVFGLVMLFHQERTEAAEAQMAELTRQLIDAALAVGGRYYLPYRRHARQDQFEACYPMAADFFTAKRRYDPQERFQNRFYQTYGR